MLWSHAIANLELRRGGDGSARLRGSFPYNKAAVLSDGGRTGRPQKEVIEPHAFAYRVDDPAEDIHLLVGHDYDMPLASKATGTLSLRDTAAALLFDATIAPEVAQTTHARDILAMIAAGLAVGISPGFRIPPKRAVPDAEEIEEEDDDPENGEHRAIIRKIKQALLYELSVVTRPAYTDAQVQMRNWSPESKAFAPLKPPAFVLNRWRL